MVNRITAVVLLCILCVPQSTPQEKIAFIGDSFTQGAVDGTPGAFIGFAGRVTEVRGATSQRWVTFTFPASFAIWPEVVAYQPDTIVLELGIHIISGLDPTTDIHGTAGDLMDAAQLLAPKVVYVLIPWRGWGDENNAQAQQINAIIREEAAQRGIRCVDTWLDMEKCGLDCIGYDDSHPNATGHQIIADAVLVAMLKYRFYIPIHIR